MSKWLEKKIEKNIVNYIQSIGWWVEQLQSWKIITRKGWYSLFMNLCSEGTPDIISLYKWKFIAIEVKKDQKQVNAWKNIETKYNDCWEMKFKSWKRTVSQVNHKKKILECWGIHLITCDIDEVKDLLSTI
jgi:hypothetical protein